MSDVRYDKTGWDATVRELWDAGLTQKEISQILGTTQMTVSRFVKRLGISVTKARVHTISSMMRESEKRVKAAEDEAKRLQKENERLKAEVERLTKESAYYQMSYKRVVAENRRLSERIDELEAGK